MMSLCCSKLHVYQLVNNHRQINREEFAPYLFSSSYTKLLIQLTEQYLFSRLLPIHSFARQQVFGTFQIWLRRRQLC